MKDRDYILLIVLGFGMVLLTSCLLDVEFIKRQVARQVVIYLLMLLELFVIFKKLFDAGSNRRFKN